MPTTSSCARCWGTSPTRRRSSSGLPTRTSSARATSCARSGTRAAAGRLSRSRSIWPSPTTAGDDRRGAAPARVGRPAEPLRQDSGDGAGPAGDRGMHRARPIDQRHAHLLPGALRRGRRGLHSRARALVETGGDPRHVASVASFFVSRVDTEADRRLEAPGQGRRSRSAASSPSRQLARLPALQGDLRGDRWQVLAERGARPPQRCLWASTSTKNPAYRDVMYVEQLIGPNSR